MVAGKVEGKSKKGKNVLFYLGFVGRISLTTEVAKGQMQTFLL